MAGLFDFQDPRAAGMYGMAAGLLKAGGPTQYPTNLGVGIGEGILTGQTMQLAAAEAKRRGELINAQVSQMAYEGSPEVRERQRRLTEAQIGHYGTQDDVARAASEAALAKQKVLIDWFAQYGSGAPQSAPTQFDASQAALQIAQQQGMPPGPTRQTAGMIPQIQQQMTQQPARPRPPPFGQLAAYDPETANAARRAWELENPPIQYNPQGVPYDRFGPVPGVASLPTAGPNQLPITIQGGRVQPVEGGVDLYRGIKDIEGRITPEQAEKINADNDRLYFDTGIRRPRVYPGMTFGDAGLQGAPRPAPVPAGRQSDGQAKDKEDILAPTLQVTPKRAAEYRADHPVTRKGVDNSLMDLHRLENDAYKLMNHPGLVMATGAMGSIFDMPGGPAQSFRADLKSLNAKVAFGGLQKMKDSSPTGSALGAVVVAELELLMNSIAAITTDQTPGQMRKNLSILVDRTRETAEGLRNGYGRIYRDVPQLRARPGSAPKRQPAPITAPVQTDPVTDPLVRPMPDAMSAPLDFREIFGDEEND